MVAAPVDSHVDDSCMIFGGGADDDDDEEKVYGIPFAVPSSDHGPLSPHSSCGVMYATLGSITGVSSGDEKFNEDRQTPRSGEGSGSGGDGGLHGSSGGNGVACMTVEMRRGGTPGALSALSVVVPVPSKSSSGEYIVERVPSLHVLDFVRPKCGTRVARPARI